MQSVPCGWINPSATLVIGRGALISVAQLERELVAIEEIDPRIRGRVFIDSEAAIIDPVRHAEGHTEGELHRRIGSTGEGIGAARVARMLRDPDLLDRYGDWSAGRPSWNCMTVSDTSSLLNQAAKLDRPVLLEGTQGAGLSLLHGPWPYVTSADVGVAALASEVGIAPNRIDRTLMVLRTFPIRVAGNSGPLYGEMTWERMSARIGRPVEERTTVTKKVRRIGEFDEYQVAGAVERNAPTHLALTFADYLSPEDEGKTEFDTLSDKTKCFVGYLERQFKTPVAFVGTGGEGFRVIERADRWR